MATQPLETAEASGYPTVRQLSVFLEEKPGQLVRLAKVLEQSDVRILGLAIVHSVDCAILRLLVDEPDGAAQVLRNGGFAVSETELLVVLLPPGKRGLLTVCTTLLQSEVNVHYTYSLLPHLQGHAAVALKVDSLDMAIRALKTGGFELLDQADLGGTL